MTTAELIAHLRRMERDYQRAWQALNQCAAKGICGQAADRLEALESALEAAETLL